MCIRDSRKLMLIGTTHGGIFRSVDGGKTWTENIAGPEMPARLISRIDILFLKETGERRVIATIAGSGVGKYLIERGPNGELLDRGYSHVFLSHDAGDHWIDLDRTQLPDLAYHSCAIENNPPYRLFVGGDFGVFMLASLESDNPEWINITGNLPHAVVSDLVYHQADRTLTAATYGRAIWRLKIDESLAGF